MTAMWYFQTLVSAFLFCHDMILFENKEMLKIRHIYLAMDALFLSDNHFDIDVAFTFCSGDLPKVNAVHVYSIIRFANTFLK